MQRHSSLMSSRSGSSSSLTPDSSLDDCNFAPGRVYRSESPSISFSSKPTLWQAVCDPPDDFLSVSNTTADERRQLQALTNCLTGSSWTFEQLHDYTIQLAAGLQSRAGPLRGKRTMILMPSEPESMILLLAVNRAGGTAIMCNANYSISELRHSVQVSDPEVIVCLRGTSGVLSNLSDLTSSITIVRSETTPDDACPSSQIRSLVLEDFQEAVKQLGPLEDLIPTENCTALIVFSSGTSGLPKAVELTNNALVSLFATNLPTGFYTFATQATAFICMSTYHIGGVCSWLLGSLKGDHCVFMPARRPVVWESWTDAIIKYRCSVGISEPSDRLDSLTPLLICKRLNLTPTIVLALVKAGLAAQIGQEGHVNYVAVGAGSLSPWLYKTAEKAFRCAIMQNYGMSEVAGGIIRSSPYMPSTPGSSGRLCGAVEARVVDEDGMDTAGAGELLLRTPTMMKGYFRDPAATMSTIDQAGWLHTGDVAYFSKTSGELFIVDRLKDMIKYKGWSISPAELEAVLNSHGSVLESAVIGVEASESCGQLPKAFVVLREGKQLQEGLEEQLHELIKSHCSPYKWLRGGIERIDHLPKNASNKILRRALRVRTS